MARGFDRAGGTLALAALVGCALISVLFIWAGYGKLMAATATKAYFAKLGLPLPPAVWLLSVLVELGGGLAILIGFKTRFVALALAAWCIVTALAAHTNFADMNMEIHFMKNLAIAGGLIFVALSGPGRLSADALIR